MPPLSNLLDPGYLFDPNPGSPSSLFAIIAIVFAVIFLSAQGVYHFWAKPAFANDAFLLRLAGKFVMIAGSVSAVALLLVLARALTLPVLSMRFLIVPPLIAAVALAVYFLYFMVRIFPAMAAIAAQQSIRQRYLPQQRPVPTVIRQSTKGKRKKKK